MFATYNSSSSYIAGCCNSDNAEKNNNNDDMYNALKIQNNSSETPRSGQYGTRFIATSRRKDDAMYDKNNDNYDNNDDVKKDCNIVNTDGLQKTRKTNLLNERENKIYKNDDYFTYTGNGKSSTIKDIVKYI